MTGTTAICAYLVTTDGMVTALTEVQSVIGRERDCQVRVRDRSTSRRHADIVRQDDDRWALRDRDSANGTWLNELRIAKAETLADGDRLRIGNQVWIFRRLPRGSDPTFDLARWAHTSASATHEVKPTAGQPPLTGPVRETTFKDICRWATLVAWTGALAFGINESDVNTAVWFVDGVPRQAVCKGRLGIDAMIGIEHHADPDIPTYWLKRGERYAGGNPAIRGTAEEVLFAVFGSAHATGSLQDLSEAENIQRHVLGDPPDIAGWDLAVHFEGATRVSGDCYEVGKLPDGRWLVAVGDVTGHGVQAALVVAGIIKTLRLLRRGIADIKELVIMLNDEVVGDLLPSQFCTMCMMAFEPHSGQVELVLAGHHPLLVRQLDGAVVERGRHAPALGLLEHDRFSDMIDVDRWRLEPGEELVLCTDGLLEVMDDGGVAFDLAGVVQVLRDQPGESIGGLVDEIVRRGRSHGDGFTDDVTVLGIQRLPQTSVDCIDWDAHPTRRSSIIPYDQLPKALRLTRVDPVRPPTTKQLDGLPGDIVDRVPPRSLQDSGDYRIDKPIGEGGIGMIYAAEQQALGRRVAVKILRDNTKPAARKLLAEARVTAYLDHPGIVPIHECGRDLKNGLFYTMQEVDGRSWAEALATTSERDNVDILLRICDALAYAHEHGVIHRDIKPANVLLGSFGEVMLVDWGLAALIGDADHPLDGVLERPNPVVAVGTPAYMAPEQAVAAAESIGTRTDVYLLGATLYQIITGHPPHDADTADGCLEQAAANIIAATQIASPWLAVALQAMATEPGDRYKDAQSFRAALRELQIHRESIVLVERARYALDRARQERNYRWYTNACAGFEQALALWHQNIDAAVGLRQAVESHAYLAIERGDVELAESLIDGEDPDQRPLHHKVIQAREERDQQRRAAIRLDSLQSELAHDTGRSWLPFYTADLEDDKNFARDWETGAGVYRLVDGGLEMSGGTPQVCRLRQEVTGDLCLTATISVQGRHLNDISFFIAAQRTPELARGIDSGYLFKFGCYDNTLNLLIRQGSRMWTQQAAPLRPGHRFTFRIERVGALLAMTVDDQTLFAIEDPEPLVGSDRCVVGVAGWQCQQLIHDLTISRLGKPVMANLLDTARRHLIQGHYTTAGDLFRDVLESDVDDAGRRAAENGLERADRGRELEVRLPVYRERITAVCPQARVQMADGGLRVLLEGLGLNSLALLRGVPVNHLNVNDNRVVDLGPLHGMPLSVLQAEGNHIVDLDPLSGARLANVNLNRNELTDVRALRHQPLSILLLTGNDISDLEPLAGTALATLMVSENKQLADLAPLAGLPLNNLYIDHTAVTDLRPIAGAPLNRLSMSRTAVDDLSPLTGMPLSWLQCNDTQVADLRPMAGMPLVMLALAGSPVTDLAPIDTSRLEFLDIGRTAIPPSQVPAHLSEAAPGIYQVEGVDINDGRF